MTRLKILAFALLPLSPLAAEQEISTSIVTLSLDQPLEGAFYQDKGKSKPYVSARSGLSAPFTYRGSRRFVIYGNPVEPSPESPPPDPLASALLPASSKSVLLVTAHTPGGELRLAAYDISSTGFKPGDYRVFNFSAETVLMILGTEKLSLKPGEDKFASHAILRDEALDVVVQFAQINDGKPKKVYSSIWGHQPVKRNFIFLSEGSHRTRPIEIRRFSDFPNPLPEGAASAQSPQR